MAAFTAVAAAIGVGLQIKSYFDQQDAREEQQQAAEQQAAAQRAKFAEDKKRADIQNTRAVRGEIRQQRKAAATMLARGAATGTAASSGVSGGVSGTGSQLAGNLSYMSDIAQTQEASNVASMQFADASTAYGKASGDMAEAQAMGALGGTIFKEAGGFNTIFGGNKGAQVGRA